MERECTTFFKHLIKFHNHREKKNAAPVHDQLAEMSDLFSVTEACNVRNLGLTIGQEGNQYLFERPGEDAFQRSVPRVCGILRSSANTPLVHQCQLEVPQFAISSRVAPNRDLHREYNPAKFQLLNLSFLCYSRQMPSDATYKDTRVSVLYTYDGRNYSVQATMYCRGAQWSYSTL